MLYSANVMFILHHSKKYLFKSNNSPIFFIFVPNYNAMGEKEYDAPTHSAEHLLNQTMDRMFGCGRTFSSHIERKKSKCDYKFHRMITQEELKQIEDTVNQLINQNLTVSETYIPRNEAISQFNLSRLPESAGDSIRIVRIGNYDACPCIGPHVESTSQIGHFKILSADYTEPSGKDDHGTLRLRFKRENQTHL